MNSIYIHNDSAYQIKRQIPIYMFSNKDTDIIDMVEVKRFRDWIKCDHVLKSDSHFIFCHTIPDIEYTDLENDECNSIETS